MGNTQGYIYKILNSSKVGNVGSILEPQKFIDAFFSGSFLLNILFIWRTLGVVSTFMGFSALSSNVTSCF
jgi:hypothetical protein